LWRPPEKHAVKTASTAASKEATPPPDQKVPTLADVDVENIEEKIWEQLIATRLFVGRSMTTVTVQETRVLLSAWEVAAFISASGQDSDDFTPRHRRARLLSAAIDEGNACWISKRCKQALAHARGEIPHFQERIDELKRTMKTDSAVNLGISVKRLLALVDEAEQIQKGNATQEGKR